MSWKLVSEKTGAEIVEGAECETFRGERCVLKGGRPPHKPGSTGRVYVAMEGEEGEPGFESEYFPGVIGAKWIEA